MSDPTAIPTVPATPRFFDRAIWLAGFRPFFALALVAGAILPMLWALSFAGVIP